MNKIVPMILVLTLWNINAKGTEVEGVVPGACYFKIHYADCTRVYECPSFNYDVYKSSARSVSVDSIYSEIEYKECPECRDLEEIQQAHQNGCIAISYHSNQRELLQIDQISGNIKASENKEQYELQKHAKSKLDTEAKFKPTLAIIRKNQQLGESNKITFKDEFGHIHTYNYANRSDEFNNEDRSYYEKLYNFEDLKEIKVDKFGEALALFATMGLLFSML